MTENCPTCGRRMPRLLSPAQRSERSAMGGIARAASMTPEQRSAVARNAAVARWAKKSACQAEQGSA